MAEQPLDEMPIALWTIQGRDTVAAHLRERGYALVRAADEFDRPNRARSEWRMSEWRTASDRRFALATETKQALSYGARDGYVLSGAKEFFHFTHNSHGLANSVATHVPTAASFFHTAMTSLGEIIMEGINQTVLVVPRSEHSANQSWYQSGSLQSGSRRRSCDLSNSVVTDFKYRATDEPLHCTAHVDGGLLTLICNPVDVEIRLPDDRWVRPVSQTSQSPVVLVLVGYMLERATAGVFQAALHRVRNSGGVRRSTVMELRPKPDLLISPAVLTSSIGPDVDASALEPFLASEHLANFARVHTSVNAPALVAASPGHAPASGVLAALALLMAPVDKLCSLPADVLLLILRHLTIRSLAATMCTSSYLRQACGCQELWVPAAERAHVDWNLALDRWIDTSAPSLGRSSTNGAPLSAAEVLARASKQWHVILGHELGDHDMHRNECLTLKALTQDGNEVYFKAKSSTPLGRLMSAFCRRQGVSMSSVRFLYGGSRISDQSSAWERQMLNGDSIDVMVEQMGN